MSCVLRNVVKGISVLSVDLCYFYRRAVSEAGVVKIEPQFNASFCLVLRVNNLYLEKMAGTFRKKGPVLLSFYNCEHKLTFRFRISVYNRNIAYYTVRWKKVFEFELLAGPELFKY